MRFEGLKSLLGFAPKPVSRRAPARGGAAPSFDAAEHGALWREGHDTLAIARITGRREADIYNARARRQAAGPLSTRGERA